MIYNRGRMQARPNKVQTAVEALYQPDARQHHGGNLDDRMARPPVPVHRPRCSCSSCSPTSSATFPRPRTPSTRSTSRPETIPFRSPASSAATAEPLDPLRPSRCSGSSPTRRRDPARRGRRLPHRARPRWRHRPAMPCLHRSSVELFCEQDAVYCPLSIRAVRPTIREGHLIISGFHGRCPAP